MFKKYCYLMFCLWCIVSIPVHADIVKINDITLLKHNLNDLNENDLVIFDIDEVVIQPVDQIFHPHNKKELHKYYSDIQNRVSPFQMNKLLSIVNTQQQIKLVDHKITDILDTLRKCSIPTIALTHSGTGKFGIIDDVTDWRITQLHALNVSFKHLNPYKDQIYNKLIGNHGTAQFKAGILFTGHVDKGKVLIEFLETNHLHPKRIIFVDDKLSNLQSVEHALSGYNIEFNGLEYTAVIDQKHAKIDPLIIHQQFLILEKELKWTQDIELITTCSVANTEIRQTADLQVIKREIFASPKDTLVVFDTDFVLIVPSDEAFILSVTDEGQNVLNKTYDDLWARLTLGDVEEIQSIVMRTKPWRPVTPDTSQIFNEIKNKGYKVLGLTSGGTGAFGKMHSLEKWMVEELKNIDIIFDKNFINAKPGALDQYIPSIDKHYAKARHVCFPAVEDGIIFTCMASKGEVLEAYLQFANIKPKKIIFIDDRLKHLETVAEFCKKFNIEYVGYEYTTIKEQARHLKLNLRRFKLQYKILELTKTWLNDAQADIILAAIDK